MSRPLAPLDAFDLRILERYQGDTRQSAEAIGDEVGLSAAAVQRRLKRLREAGVIVAETAQLDPRQVGLPVSVIVAVDLIDEGQASMDRFCARMRASPHVQQCYATAGEVDYILVLLFPDLGGYERFAREQLAADTNVRSFTTHVVLNTVKSGTQVPLAAAGVTARGVNPA